MTYANAVKLYNDFEEILIGKNYITEAGIYSGYKIDSLEIASENNNFWVNIYSTPTPGGERLRWDLVRYLSIQKEIPFLPSEYGF